MFWVLFIRCACVVSILVNKPYVLVQSGNAVSKALLRDHCGWVRTLKIDLGIRLNEQRRISLESAVKITPVFILSAPNMTNDVLLNSPKWYPYFLCKQFRRIFLFILNSL